MNKSISTLIIIVALIVAILGGKVVKAEETKHPLVDWVLPIKAYCTDINDLEIWFSSGVIQPSCVNIPHKPLVGKIKTVLKPIHWTRTHTFWMVKLYNGAYVIAIIPDPK